LRCTADRTKDGILSGEPVLSLESRSVDSDMEASEAGRGRGHDSQGYVLSGASSGDDWLLCGSKCPTP
jgi:hypothetical protein